MRGRSPAKTPEAYIANLEEPRRSEIAELDRLIRETAPGLDPHIRSGMIGYGTYHYKYASGREGDWFRIGLASNKSYISLYACATDGKGHYIAETYKKKLPKANIGKSCVRFRSLNQVDLDVLTQLIEDAVRGTFGDRP